MNYAKVSENFSYLECCDYMTHPFYGKFPGLKSVSYIRVYIQYIVSNKFCDAVTNISLEIWRYMKYVGINKVHKLSGGNDPRWQATKRFQRILRKQYAFHKYSISNKYLHTMNVS